MIGKDDNRCSLKYVEFFFFYISLCIKSLEEFI